MQNRVRAFDRQHLIEMINTRDCDDCCNVEISDYCYECKEQNMFEANDEFIDKIVDHVLKGVRDAE